MVEEATPVEASHASTEPEGGPHRRGPADRAAAAGSSNGSRSSSSGREPAKDGEDVGPSDGSSMDYGPSGRRQYALERWERGSRHMNTGRALQREGKPKAALGWFVEGLQLLMDGYLELRDGWRRAIVQHWIDHCADLQDQTTGPSARRSRRRDRRKRRARTPTSATPPTPPSPLRGGATLGSRGRYWKTGGARGGGPPSGATAAR